MKFVISALFIVYMLTDLQITNANLLSDKVKLSVVTVEPGEDKSKAKASNESNLEGNPIPVDTR